MRVAVRLALGPALLILAVTAGQAQPRPWNPHSSLTNAIACSRRGDYEMADAYFRQAQSAQGELTAVEQQELANEFQRNVQALNARREGAARLAQAEDAFRNGRAVEANFYLKEVTVNQFLTPADRQRALQLGEALRSGAAHPRPEDTSVAGFRGTDTSTQQAYGNPPKASPDKPDSKGLLVAGRIALQRGEFDEADRLAHEADKASSIWSWRPWGDNPSKLMRDVQYARARPPITNPAQARAVADANTDMARQLLQQGRQALRASDFAHARDFAQKADGLRPNLAWNEDNPDKLLADIQAVEKPQDSGLARVSAASANKVEANLADAGTLLKQGRELYAAGKLDDARDKALLAQGAPDARWGILGDTPDKLLRDIQKTRLKRDQEEAERQLAEGRKLFEQGDMAGARAKAYRAERLHGPYSLWDLGDRPQKLLADIENVESKKQKIVLPPAPPPPPQTIKSESGKSPVPDAPGGTTSFGNSGATNNPGSAASVPAQGPGTADSWKTVK